MTRVAALLYGLPDAAVGVDAAGIVVVWNAAAARLFATSEEAALGQPAAALCGDLSRRHIHVSPGGVNVDSTVDAVDFEGAAAAGIDRVYVFREAKPASPADRLPPRLAETLRCLLAGSSEKEIAAELSLSHHTVHDYVKTLYRRFGVQSRAELMARALSERPPRPT